MRTLRRSGWRAAVVLGGALATACVAGPGLAPASTYVLHGAPNASFAWFPQSPSVGQPVTLVSTSTDLTSPITGYAWDVSGDGALGALVPGAQSMTTSFTTPAPHTVRLRVTNADGLADVTAETITMGDPPAGVLLPFPVVRIIGSDLKSGVLLKRLAVEAPSGASIKILCASGACPRHLRHKTASAHGRTGKFVRFRRFERRLGAGVKLEIRVSKRNEVGAYTRFVVRRRRVPTRVDACLDPAGVKPIACPSQPTG